MKRGNEYYHFMPSLQQRTECNLDQIAIYKISNSTNTQLIHRTRTKLTSSLYYLAIWKHNNPNLGNVYPQLRDQIIEEKEWNIIELPRVPQYHISWLKDIDGRNANQNVKNTFESIISEKINQLSGDSIGCIDTYEIYSYLELRDSRAALKNSWIGLQFKKLEQVLVESTDQIRNSIGAGYYDNISFTMTDGVYGINCRFYVTVPETGKARVEMKVEYV